MANFHEAHRITAHHEGGYAHNPKDTGGETLFGVARKHWPDWPGWPHLDRLKTLPGFPGTANSSAQLKALAAQFYKQNFWDVFRLDQVHNQAIANEVFDTAVNMGVAVAAQFLQRAINVTNRGGSFAPEVAADGKVGPLTVAALNQHKRPQMVLKVLNALQGERYVRIAERNPSQEVFMESWLSRVG
jgi:lysozyme family protein